MVIAPTQESLVPPAVDGEPHLIRMGQVLLASVVQPMLLAGAINTFPTKFLRFTASSSTLGAFVAHSYIVLLLNATILPSFSKLDPLSSIAALLALALMILVVVGNVVQVR